MVMVVVVVIWLVVVMAVVVVVLVVDLMLALVWAVELLVEGWLDEVLWRKLLTQSFIEEFALKFG